jgi:signal transduction histidine kinase
MNSAGIRTYLFPQAEKDEGFRSELERQSVTGMKVIGWVNIGTAAFLTLARFVVAPDPATLPMRLLEGALIVLVGIAMLAGVRTAHAQKRARPISIASGFITATVLIWFSLCRCEMAANADDFIPGQVTLVLLVGIAAVPLKPLHTFFLGMAMLGSYWGSARLSDYLGLHHASLEPTYALFIVTLTLLGTALTAIVYEQRRQNYHRHQTEVRFERELKEAQRRMLLSENAASLGRLAAALSHELNSPIGALKSAVDTLLLLSARQSVAPLDEKRFVALIRDLRNTIQESSDRLSSIVTRMQRIANLDRSEVQRVRLNELLSDVIALCDSRYTERATLETDLKEVPALICKPQQLSAVFRNILNNSADALNGGGKIRVSSRSANGQIEIEISDSGRGMTKEEMENVFDPGFRVSADRMGTGNWSMFSSRQVIHEHGGEIRIDSAPGEGTTVKVTFPLSQTAPT